MSDIYSSNPRKNTNTSLQASTLESGGGLLHKVFDIQAVRTIKGRVIFPGSNPYGFIYNWNTITQNATVVNEYDNSPVCFNPGDIVLSAVIANGSYIDISMVTNPYNYPSPFTNGTVRLYYNESPTYNPRYKLWEPSSFIEPLTDSFDVTTLTSSVDNITPISQPMSLLSNSAVGSINNESSNCYGGHYQWLSCFADRVDNGYYHAGETLTTFTPTMVALNFTLLVINPFNQL